MFRREEKQGNRVEYYLRDELIGTYYPPGDKLLLELLYMYGTQEARHSMDLCQREGTIVIEGRTYKTNRSGFKSYYLEAGQKMLQTASNCFIKSNKMVVYSYMEH